MQKDTLGKFATALVITFGLGAVAIVKLTNSVTNVEAATTCVVTIFGQQYNVAPLQATHTGGNIFVCGTDMTTTYQNMHGTNVSRMTAYLYSPSPTPTTIVTATPTIVSTGSPIPTPTTNPLLSPTPTTVIASPIPTSITGKKDDDGVDEENESENEIENNDEKDEKEELREDNKELKEIRHESQKDFNAWRKLFNRLIHSRDDQ